MQYIFNLLHSIIFLLLLEEYWKYAILSNRNIISLIWEIVSDRHFELSWNLLDIHHSIYAPWRKGWSLLLLHSNVFVGYCLFIVLKITYVQYVYSYNNNNNKNIEVNKSIVGNAFYFISNGCGDRGIFFVHIQLIWFDKYAVTHHKNIFKNMYKYVVYFFESTYLLFCFVWFGLF